MILGQGGRQTVMPCSCMVALEYGSHEQACRHSHVAEIRHSTHANRCVCAPWLAAPGHIKLMNRHACATMWQHWTWQVCKQLYPLPIVTSLGHNRHVNGCARPATWRWRDMSDMHKKCALANPWCFLDVVGVNAGTPVLPLLAAPDVGMGLCAAPCFLVFRHNRCEHACPQHRHLGALGHGRCTNHQVVVLEHNRCMNRCAPLPCGITGTTP